MHRHHLVQGTRGPHFICPPHLRPTLQQEAQERLLAKPFVKADGGKPRWTLLPFDALAEVVKVLEHGAQKYQPDNWRKCPDATRYVDALMRHLAAYQTGETKDAGQRPAAPRAPRVLCALPPRAGEEAVSADARTIRAALHWSGHAAHCAHPKGDCNCHLAFALEAVDRMEAQLRRANDVVHSDYCTDTCHPLHEALKT
jgi:hypothetical protein